MEDTRPVLLIGTPYYGGFTHQYVLSVFVESAQVHMNRNIIFSSAYKNNADYLLFIDTDMMWLPSHIEKLIDFDKDVVGGLCTTRKTPLINCVYENNGRGLCKAIKDVPKVPFKCFAIGTGFLLIRKRIIRMMWEQRHKHGYPFDPIAHGLTEQETGHTKTGYRGTDISFCQRLRKVGVDIWCMPSVKPGHVGEMTFGRAEEEDG